MKWFGAVFLDLNGEQDGDDANEKEEDDGGENNKEVNELQAEWEEVFCELKRLLSCNGSETGTCDKIDVRERNDDVEDDFQGTQDVRDICATIDLTQSPRRAASSINWDSASESEAEPTKTDSDQTFSDHDVLAESDVEIQQDDEEQKQEQQQLRQSRISKLLTRLHEIHTILMDLAPSNTKSQLKSKYLSLQKTNAALQSDINAFQSIQTSLQSRLNQAKQSLHDRNLEIERELRKHHQSHEQYARLLEQYSTYQTESDRKINDLQQSNLELKRNYDRLKDTSGLDDMREMREITEKYGRMSQEVYDLRNENRVLKRRLEERERRRGEMEKIRGEVSTNRAAVGKENARGEPGDSRKSAYSSKVANLKSDSALQKKSNNSSRAMDILNSAPSRKSVSKHKSNNVSYHQKQRHDQNISKRNHVRDISRFDNDENDSDSDDLDVQMLPTSKKHKQILDQRQFNKHETRNRWEADDEDDSNSDSFNVQLIMKPRKSSRPSTRPAIASNQSTEYLDQRSQPASKAIPFQRNDSTNTVSSTVGTKRAFTESASLSRNKLFKRSSSQSISSFFKPVER